MNIFSTITKQITRPYTHAFKEISGSARRIGAMLQEARAGQRAARAEKENNPALQAAKAIDDDRARFEFLYREMGWTPQALRGQINDYSKSQRIYLVFTAASLALALWLASLGGVFGAATGAMSFMITILFAAKTFQCALWHVQLQERDLLTLARFTARPRWYVELFK